MARRPARRRDEDETTETVEETSPSAETAQEGADEQAPETSNEESTVTVTEPEVEAPEAADVDNAETATDSTNESAPAQADAAAESNEAPVEKSKDDLEAEFRQATEDAVELADTDTGSVPEIGVDKVLTAYRALPSTASKSAVKNWLGEEMRDALIAVKIGRARALADINTAVQDASMRRSAAAPAKPSKSAREVYLDHCLALDIAKQFVVRPSDEELGEGWNEEYHQRYADYVTDGGPVAQYLAWLAKSEAERGDEPEVDAVVKNAAKLASGRAVGARKSSGSRRSSGGTSSGVRRNVGAHIEEFLAQADPGQEYTIAEVANFNSSEYGEDHPSPGAVAARLTPAGGKASTIPGFEVVPNSEPKKIRKI